MSAISDSAADKEVPFRLVVPLRRVQLVWLGHWLPLAILLGNVALPFAGRSFVFPRYLPLIYLALCAARFRVSWRAVPRQDVWVGLYGLAALCSFPFATDLLKYGYGAFALFLVGLPAYALGRRLAASRVWSPRTLEVALVATAAAISALYLLGLALYPRGFYIAYLLLAPRVAGMNALGLVSFHILGLAATISLLKRTRSLGTQVLLLALLMLDIVGGLSFNSKAYLMLLAVPLVIGAAAGRSRGTRLLRVVLVVAVLGIAARPPEGLITTVTGRWTGYVARTTDWRDDARVQLWRRCLEVWGEHPLFGHGLTNSFLGIGFMERVLYSRWTIAEIQATLPEKLAFRGDGFYMAHNTVLQLLIEVGLVGLVIFCAIFARFLRSLLRLARSPDATTRAVAGALLMGTIIAAIFGMFQNNFLTRDFGALYWFLVGLACSWERRGLAPSPQPETGSASG